MFSAVASGIFAFRNADKTRNGEIGRSAVTVGQTAGLVQEAAKGSSVFSGLARSTISGFSNLAKDYKALDYTGKAVKFAADNVNPLICASGVIKTAMSDDKVGTGVTEVAALGTMFAGEGLIKLHYDKIVNSDTVKQTGKTLAKVPIIKQTCDYVTKHKLGGKIGAITKGLVFVGGSMGSYAVGEKIGNDAARRVKANLNITANKKIDRKA